MPQLDHQIPRRQIDKQVVPGRSVGRGPLVVELIGLHQRSQMFLAGAVEPQRGDAQAVGPRLVADPEAVEPGAFDMQRDRDRRPLVAGAAGEVPVGGPPAVAGLLGEPLRLDEDGAQRLGGLKGLGRKQLFGREPLPAHIFVERADGVGLMAEMPERHAQRIAGTQRLIHDAARTRLRRGLR